MDFELFITRYRIRSALTQTALARRSGLTQGYISKLESIHRNEEQSPTLKCLFKIGRALELCPYELFRCTGDCKTCKLKRNIEEYKNK